MEFKRKEDRHMHTDDVLELLNVSPKTLDHLVDNSIVLCIVEEDGSELYPYFQFTRYGIDGGFASISSCFRDSNISGKAIWEWLNEPLEELNNQSPLEYFQRTNDSEPIRAAAFTKRNAEVASNLSQQRTDWSKTSNNESIDGIGDYTPKRRGGQHDS